MLSLEKLCDLIPMAYNNLHTGPSQDWTYRERVACSVLSFLQVNTLVVGTLVDDRHHLCISSHEAYAAPTHTLSPSDDVWVPLLNSGGKHHDNNTISFISSDNASTGDLYKYLRKPTMVGCYSIFQLKFMDFFVSQVNDKIIMDK